MVLTGACKVSLVSIVSAGAGMNVVMENKGPDVDRTLVIVKPHAVDRGLIGTLLERFERMGLRIAAITVVNGSRELWDRFYPSDTQWLQNVGSKTYDHCKQRGINVEERLGTNDAIAIGRMVKGWLIDNMSSGPSIAAVLTGNEAALKVRIACGKTLPNMAAPGTIRFDFSTDSPGIANDEKRPVYNLIHASDPEEVRGEKGAVDYEIDMLFPEL